jgi:two-component system, NtrC family, response regulator AtoC
MRLFRDFHLLWGDVQSPVMTLWKAEVFVNPGRQKRILVVDDQAMVAESLKMALEFSGYEVHTAENGRMALALFEPQKFDVIFTDFEMPEMNGHEFASIVKARDPRQPIIMVTAYADAIMTMDPFPQVDLVISKPWSLEELRIAMAKVMPIS